MSKNADRPDWEYGLGLRECKARSNPWDFIDGSLKAETCGARHEAIRGAFIDGTSKLSPISGQGRVE